MLHVKWARLGYAVTSLMLALTGLTLLIWPGLPASVLCYPVGIIVLVCGAAKVYGYFAQDLYRLAFQYDLALGLLTILLGAAMLFLPQRLAGGMFTVLAVYVLINAMFTVQTAVEAQRFGLDRWWLLMMGGIGAGLLGLLTLLRPNLPAEAAAQLTGVALLADGVQNLLVALLTICVKGVEQPAEGRVPARRMTR